MGFKPHVYPCFVSMSIGLMLDNNGKYGGYGQ